jgi:hypothetical protein
MKTNFWLVALRPFVSAVVAFATAGRGVASIPDQFENPVWSKHLGRLLISTMKASHAQLIATLQFDSGRWKLRLESAPISADKQSNEPLVSNIAVAFTMLSPLVCLIAAYLWAHVIG